MDFHQHLILRLGLSSGHQRGAQVANGCLFAQLVDQADAAANAAFDQVAWGFHGHFMVMLLLFIGFHTLLSCFFSSVDLMFYHVSSSRKQARS